jgi:hypothetical protein
MERSAFQKWTCVSATWMFTAQRFRRTHVLLWWSPIHTQAPQIGIPHLTHLGNFISSGAVQVLGNMTMEALEASMGECR